MSTDYELIIEQQDIIKNTLERKQEVCRHSHPKINYSIFILKAKHSATSRLVIQTTSSSQEHDEHVAF